MFFSQFHSFLLILAATHQTAGYKLNFRRNERCTSEEVDVVVAGPNQGCLNKPPNALSATISSTGAIDDDFAITFFSGADCEPETAVWHSVDIISGETDYVCFTGRNEQDQPLQNGWSSYEIWDVRNSEL